MTPIPVDLFDGHAPGILAHGLGQRRGCREQNPGLSVALSRRAGRRSLATPFMLAVLGVATGAGSSFACRPGILLMLWRGSDGGADDDPTWDERLVGSPASD